jgi:hypothetical protein
MQYDSKNVEIGLYGLSREEVVYLILNLTCDILRSFEVRSLRGDVLNDTVDFGISSCQAAAEITITSSHL